MHRTSRRITASSSSFCGVITAATSPQLISSLRAYRVAEQTEFFLSWSLRKKLFIFLTLLVALFEFFAPKRLEWHEKNYLKKKQYYKEADEKRGYQKEFVTEPTSSKR